MSRILGHADVLARLFRAQFFPAMLFSGPEGLGKRLVALRYAAFLNCLEQARDDCSCLSCRKMQGGNHPDLVMVERAAGKLSLGVAEAREVISQLNYRPYEGRCRVCVVCEADRLTDEAQSALLKTLEEPPPGNLLVLVTSQLSKLLPTVVSRCRLQTFQPVSQGALEAFLGTQGATGEEALRWARIAQGCPGRALRGLQQPALAEAHRKVNDLLDGMPGQSLWGTLQCAQQLDQIRLPELEGRAATDEILRLIESYYRERMLAQGGQVLRALEAVQEGRQHLDNNVNTKLLMQSLCLRAVGMI